MNEIGTVETVFLLLLSFVVLFGIFARKLGTPYPIVMVIGGLILGFIPMIPDISLNPDLIFLIILPPLFYSSAWTTSWRDFRYNLPSISLLAVGLVGFTVVGVALAAPHVFAGFDWRMGLVLGAVVAPTDAIAATSIARRIGLPARIVDVLEGESLVNDATGLLALEFATGILVNQEIPTVARGVLTLLWLTAGGIAIGLLVGWIVDRIERMLDDASIEITLSILVPYFAYLAAQWVHASGVLAVVTCGLYLTGRSAHIFSPAVRIRIWSVWQSLTFILNGVVFVLIGLQFPAIRRSLSGEELKVAIRYGLVFSLLLILLRLIWMFPGAHLSYFLRLRFSRRGDVVLPLPPARQIFVVGWTGMRGVVSLAAAMALPATLADGSAFPHRAMIVFLTFSVILVTLVLQGLTLPPLIRALGLAGDRGPDCEELEARRIVTAAAVKHLEDARHHDQERPGELYEDLALHYRSRLESLHSDGDESDTTIHDHYIELSLETLRVERETAIRLRNEGRINDAVLRRLERELDLDESRLTETAE
jgi:monovalent cation/hydrogen antiporter